MWTFTYVFPLSSALRTDALTVARPCAPLLHGAQSGTITGPGTPGAPLWMCAAIARPLSFENVSRQTITPVVPVREIVAVNAPCARRTLPLGFGLSWLARSVVLTLAAIATCPRISPAGFVGVCTFAYAFPDWIASRTDASTFAVPVTPLLHGAHNGTRTGPATPGAAT